MAKILMVDDGTPGSAMMRHDLLREGHRPFQVASAQAALRILDAGVRVDVVLIDLVTPWLEGIELIQTVRRGHPAVRIVALATCGNQHPPDILSAARESGADRVLYKPTVATVLGATIRHLLWPGPAMRLVIDGTVRAEPQRHAA